MLAFVYQCVIVNMINIIHVCNYLTGALLFIGYRAKKKPKSLNKGPIDKVQREAESSSYPFLLGLFIPLSGNVELLKIS